MRKKYHTLFYIIAFLSFFIALYQNEGLMKYIVYLIFIYLLFIRFFAHKYRMALQGTRVLSILMGPPFFAIIYTLLTGGLSSSGQMIFFLKDAVFITIPIFFAFIMILHAPTQEGLLWVLFLALVSEYVFRAIPSLPALAEYIAQGLLNPLNSDSPLESGSAYTFGLFMLYFIHRKANRKTIIFTGLMVLLANKRIVTFSLPFCLLGYYLLSRFSNTAPQKRRFLLRTGATLSIIVQLGFIFLLHSGRFIEWLQRYGISHMGRAGLYARIASDYRFSPGFIGHGIGFALYRLEGINLHSDILKLYIELGFWGFLLYNLLFFRIVFHVNKQGDGRGAVFIFTLLIYSILLYFTDNVSIYINYLIPFYMMIFAEVKGMGLLPRNNPERTCWGSGGCGYQTNLSNAGRDLDRR